MSFFKGFFGGKSYWSDASSALILLFAGVLFTLISGEPQIYRSALYYLVLGLIVVAILIQYSVHRNLEKNIEELELRIKILELENQIRNLEELNNDQPTK